jgi:hypothetical protein
MADRRQRIEPRPVRRPALRHKVRAENKDFANGRGEETEEYIHRLDQDQDKK